MTTYLATEPVAGQQQVYVDATGATTNDLGTARASWQADAEFKGDWGLGAIRADGAYARGITGQGVKVGIVDSGILTTHPEFAGRGVQTVTTAGTYYADGSMSSGSYTAGQTFSVDGGYNSTVNDDHGTHVGGTIAAARDGTKMHGVAYKSTLYVSNTNANDSTYDGVNADYNYFKAAYGNLASQGVRLINTSWGSDPPEDSYSTLAGLIDSYNRMLVRKTWLDAIAEVSQEYRVIQLFAAGNKGVDNPNTSASLPYFRPELEQYWVAVTSSRITDAQTHNKCGVAKYWCVAAPGSNIVSTVTDSDGVAGYDDFSGTSMAAPHASGSLALIMERYPYMTNEQARVVMLTTARHAGSGATDVPNEEYGWGIVDVDKAMSGPSQFLSRFDANLPSGSTDIWSNSISDAALVQRKSEEQAEIAAWTARKTTLGITDGIPADTTALAAKLGVAYIDSIPTAKSLLEAAITANTESVYTAEKLSAALAALKAAPGGAELLALYEAAKPGWTGPYSRTTDYATFIASYADDTAIATAMGNSQVAVLKTEYPVAETRTAYLATKSYEGGLTKSGGGTLILTGANTYKDDTIVNGGILQIGNGGAIGSLVSNVVVNTDGILAFNRSDSYAYDGNISGAGAVAALGGSDGLGTLVLGGVNIYSGSTYVYGGTLRAGSATGFSRFSAFVTNVGATLDLGGFDAAIGSLSGTGGTVSLRAGRLTTGGNDSSTSFGGEIAGSGGLTKTGTGIFALSGANSYTGTTVVEAGTLRVDSSIASSSMTWVNAGATLGGNGAVGNTTINGGTLSPGNSIGILTVQGDLAFTGSSRYAVEVSPTSADRTNVTGRATLGGAGVAASFSTTDSDTYVAKQHTILNAAGGVEGSFGSLVNTNLPTNFKSGLSYDANNAYLSLSLDFTPAQGGLDANQASVAQALTTSFDGNGGIPLVFGSLSSQQLSQASGQTAVGMQQSTIGAMNQFSAILTDPSIAGGGDAGRQTAASSGDAGPAMSYASVGRARSAREEEAYAAVSRKVLPASVDPFAQRWTVWAAGFGGKQMSSGNAAQGSSNAHSRSYGLAVGLDYRLSQDTVAGVAMAGGTTSFSVAGSGSGTSDMIQAGVSLRHAIGPAYLAGVLAYGRQDVATERPGDERLSASFQANAYSGRIEGGYRIALPALALTPYAAAQITRTSLPSYAETGLGGAQLGLTYDAKDSNAARTELGLRLEKPIALTNSTLVLRGRAAWAHDFDGNRSVTAGFSALPGTSFVVRGASQARNVALVTAGAELGWRNGFSVAATFEGEFSQTSSSYGGRGTLKYSW